LLSIHTLGNHRYQPQPAFSEMLTGHHLVDDVREQSEVALLGGYEWVLFEKRNNRSD
jgi:hypothetical protein